MWRVRFSHGPQKKDRNSNTKITERLLRDTDKVGDLNLKRSKNYPVIIKYCEVIMKEFAVKSYQIMPEHPTISLYTNGSQGGDSGHGGQIDLIIEFDSTYATSTQVLESDGSLTMFDDEVKRVVISMYGDWEINGFAAALMDIGNQLMQREDCLEVYNEIQSYK